MKDMFPVAENCILLYFVIAALLRSIPRFVVAEAEQCLVKGQDLHIHCQLKYSKDEPTYPKMIDVELDNVTLRERFLDQDNHRLSHNITNLL